jgi:hypothetical protein
MSKFVDSPDAKPIGGKETKIVGWHSYQNGEYKYHHGADKPEDGKIWKPLTETKEPK